MKRGLLIFAALLAATLVISFACGSSQSSTLSGNYNDCSCEECNCPDCTEGCDSQVAVATVQTVEGTYMVYRPRHPKPQKPHHRPHRFRLFHRR